jgi:hypothetical protein
MTAVTVRNHEMTRTDSVRSTKMYTLYEALARDRMRATDELARQRRIARELAAARRWHRLEQRARSARHRHAMRAH